jgi:hypothetical protein
VSISEKIFKLFNNIDVGALLSRPFYKLRNIAIAMRANQAGILHKQALQFLKQEDRPPPCVALQRLCQNSPRQKPHLVRFIFKEGFFTAVVRKPSALVYIEPMIFPQYSVLSF